VTRARLAWSRARCFGNTHLLVLFEKLKKEDTPTDCHDAGGNLHPGFDPEKLDKLALEKVVWWDETHKKCRIGGFG
jgi:hypothetical protein